MRKLAVLAGILVLGGVASAADPQLMNMIMPDAKVLAGANVTASRISPLGLFLLGKIQAGGDLQKFPAATGVDPLQDVTEVLAATNGDTSKPSGLILLRGSFKVAEILAKLPSAQVTKQGDINVISVGDGKSKAEVALAFVGNSIAVAGDVASVTAAVQRANIPASMDPKLAVQVNGLSAANDAWMVSTVGIASLMPKGDGKNPQNAQLDMAAQMLKNVQGLSGGVKFGTEIQAKLEIVSDTAKNAEALGDVAKLVISLASMNMPKDPQTAQWMKLLQTLQITTQETAVDLAFTVPEATVEGLLKN